MESSCLVATYTLPRRTRKNVKQSKNGCYTCKARRLKCDETRPQCLRCQRAQKQCLGYAQTDQSPSTDSESSMTTSNFDLQDLSNDHMKLHTLPVLSLEDSRLANLGLEVLFQGRNETMSWGLSAGWLQTLSQSLATNDAVLKCLLCLGSACDTFFLSESSPGHLPLIMRHHSAISAVQKEISMLKSGPLPVFLASILLAVASVLLQRLEMALTHVQGAFKSLALLLEAGNKHSVKAQGHVYEGIEHLRSIALSLDMHTGWYRLSQPPDLPRSIEITKEVPNTCTMSKLDSATLLHDCYHFTSVAMWYKYRPRSDIPDDLIREQYYLIAALNQIIADNTSPNQLNTRETTSISLIQAVQCLSTLTYISTILQPYESAYDQFDSQFSRVIEISEILISRNQKRPNNSCLPRFQLQPGLFQPLFFTAMKCRVSSIRYRAVELLEKLKFEGPWNSRINAGVARRVITIEEKTDVPIDTNRRSDVFVSERDRVHGCGINSPPFDETSFPAIVQIELSRCFDVEEMICLSKEEQKPYWDNWGEDIEIPSYI